jgi:hypothetical protein
VRLRDGQRSALQAVGAQKICCLIQKQCELGIEPSFWQNKEREPSAQAIILSMKPA